MRNLSWSKILAFLGVQLKIKGMIIRAIAIMAAVFLLTGCGKKPETSTSAVQSAPRQTNNQTPAVSAPAVASPGQTNVTATPDLKQMTKDVHIWMANRRRIPKDFEEFAASVSIKFPPPPPGKKYALDKAMRVILVNR
jgi:predicted small lipoprotein YifL